MPPNLNGLHLILPRDATEKWPESLAQLWRDQGPAFFGAKDAMVVGADVGHPGIQPSLRDFGNSQLTFPNVETLGYCQDVPPGQTNSEVKRQ